MLVVAASAATVALLAASPASAGTAATAGPEVTPPRGIPDLASMALSVEDLAPGAGVARQGYVKPDGVVATYVREFRPGAATKNGKRFLYLESDVDLFRSVADARLFVELAAFFSSAVDEDELEASFEEETGLEVKYVRVGRPTRLGAGEQSLGVTIRIGTGMGELRTVLGLVRVNRIVGYVTFVGPPRAKVGLPEAAALSRAAAARMRAGLRPRSTAPPAISGAGVVGQPLTASTGSWSNAPTSYGFAWQRCDAAGAACTVIAGSTTATFVPTAAEQGMTIRVVVTATNGFGPTPAVSAPTSPIAAAPGAPANTAPPSLAGTAAVGQTLTASAGTWTGNPSAFAYAWQRCGASGDPCVVITGATASTYVLTSADAGSTVRVAVTATNALGSATAVSAPTAVVT